MEYAVVFFLPAFGKQDGKTMSMFFFLSFFKLNISHLFATNAEPLKLTCYNVM